MKFLSPTEIRARALEEAAADIDWIESQQGAHPGAVQAWDALCEEPAEWLRKRAATLRKHWNDYQGDTNG